MAFPLSPGVTVSETDLTTIVPAVATTDGAIGGVFRWGPIGQRLLVDDEKVLVNRYGRPTNHNAETFFTAANFLAYGNRLYVSRAAKTTGSTPANLEFQVTGNTTVGNSVLIGVTTGLEAGMYINQTSNTEAVPANQTGESYFITAVNSSAITLNKQIFPAINDDAEAANSNLNFARLDTTYSAVGSDADPEAVIVANLVHQIVKNETEFSAKEGSFDSDIQVVARYPGKMGNSLRVAVCDTADGFSSNVALVDGALQFHVGSEKGYVISNSSVNTSVNAAYNAIAVGDYIVAGNSAISEQYLLVTSKEYVQNTTATVEFGNSGANGGINTTTGFVFINNRNGNDLRFNVGDIVTYSNTVGAATGGLSSGSQYYVVDANTSGVRLSASRDGVSAITAGAGGSEHEFVLDVNKLVLTFQDPYRLRQNFSTTTARRFWEYFNVVDSAPGQSEYQLFNGNTSANDELHVVVVDEHGSFTGTPGTVVEVYAGVSRATDAKNDDGTTNYYRDIINDASQYIYWVNDRSGAESALAIDLGSATTSAPARISLRLGSDGLGEANATLSILGEAYDQFVSTEDIDISLVMQGRPVGGTTVVGGQTVTNFQLANYIIDNIADVRKDCVAFVSPDKSMVINNIGNEALSVKNWRGAVRNTSYGVMDSGYKYQYDRYNDIYRWIPLNGDIAGLCARTDTTNDAWWSPAGFNRGNIKNIVKLAWNPRQSERDIIYPAGINPVVTFPGQGTVLYGDRTLQSKPSAFDRINVRRLFIVLEKAISAAAKYSMFEFNDAFTRAQFKNLVNPFLRTVHGRRGITDFFVQCDENNNTPQVIDSNQFVGDIYIKPARSINFIKLNFVAVGTGVQFSEIIDNPPTR